MSSARGRTLLLALAAVVIAGGLMARRHHERAWRAPAFAFLDQHGRTVTGVTLRGRPWIADFIFTRCTSACPLLTARMVLLQRRLAASDLRFVSFSVDPEHDTPVTLQRYAQEWHGDDERWHLLATTPAPLEEVAAGLHAMAAQTMHSNRFVLVDGDGVVRGTYDGSDDGAMDRLARDAAALARPLVAPAREVAAHDGAALFARLGCAGCHGDGRVARPLAGLYSSRVTLDDGRTIVADDAYLRESIVDPLAKIVAGAPPSMPSYGRVLDGRSLDALVAYIESLPPPVAAH